MRWSDRILPSLWLAILFAALPAQGQELSRVSLDSVTMIDLFRGNGTTGNPDASVDISSVIRVANGWSIHVRPWFFKSSANGSTWSREIYQAALRYERFGRRAVRLDAGYIASPVGLGMLDMRADLNPTIQPHLSYYVPLLPFDRGAPGVGPIAASYPLGANVTVSSMHWDLRGALLAQTPTRRYAVNAARGNPKLTPTVVVGGGVTPFMGLRIGGSLAAGRYAAPGEVSDPTGTARNLRMWTAEGEYEWGYTKLSAEFTRERFARGAASDTSATWFVQGVRTLAPRWFVAGRHETISAPPPVFAAPGSPRLTFRTTEGTVGYRITPGLTTRASLTAQRFYTAPATDYRVGVQLVWSRRWW